ncbi:MAG: glycosyltransferase [Flavobacteriaceae bacterium]|nr:glycosyltransferase [Flavobacteriaceae bacterium]
MNLLFVKHNFKQIIKVDGIKDASSYNESELLPGLITLAKMHPEYSIVWFHESIDDQLNLDYFSTIDHVQAFLISYAPSGFDYISPEIGLVDQSVFINVNKKVRYPTWLMSALVGIISPGLLNQLDAINFQGVTLDFVLNSLAKNNMPKGLLCYSDPKLLKSTLIEPKSTPQISQKDLYRFVLVQYKWIWVYLMFLQLLIYKNKSTLFSLLISLLKKGKVKTDLKLNHGFIPKNNVNLHGNSIDVIIPTLNRKAYLFDFLQDLKSQTLIPNNVIIIEQLHTGLKTELDYLNNDSWPFKIMHRCIHTFGACNARNLALNLVESDWVFLGDDDIRIKPDFMENAMIRLKHVRASAATFSCNKSYRLKINLKVKQWSDFGSGSSIIHSSLLKENCSFDTRFEHGYGEDSDFGMQIRNAGYDIFYFNFPEILHLKAPSGGFRESVKLAWDIEKITPKPSPTVTLFNLMHLTDDQKLGFKTIFWIKNLSNTYWGEKLKYLMEFSQKWHSSHKWGMKLLEGE